MFVGHFAVGFAAKKAAPRTSLATLLCAALWSDFVFSVLLVAGVERAEIMHSPRYMPVDLGYIPWSHSLVATIFWAAVAGAAYLAAREDNAGARAVTACVLSHWVLDALSHRPDMPLSPGLSTKVGLGLWNSGPATFLVEGGLFAAAVWLYSKATRPIDRAGRWGYLGLAALLAVLFTATFFAPPPPNTRAMGLGNLGALPLLYWAAWADRHRASVGS